MTTDQQQRGVEAYQHWKANVGNSLSSAYGGNLHDLARRMYEAMADTARPEVAQNDIADVQNAAWAFRETLIPRADQMAGGVFPLWHGWAIFDAFMAGAAFARSPLAHKEKP